MKNIIFLKKEIPNRIRKQVEYWNLFAKLAPIAFVVGGFFFYELNFCSLQTLLFVGAGLFAVTAVIWWFWTVNTIGFVSDRVHKAEEGIQDVLSDLKIIKELFREIKDNNNKK